MGLAIGLAFIGLFSWLNAFVWLDSGYVVHLLGMPVPAYSLIWVWIALIAIIVGANYAVANGEKRPIWWIISAWWTANIGVLTWLQSIDFRGIEDSGGLVVISMFDPIVVKTPALMLDFATLGALDFLSLLIVWACVHRNLLKASVWVVIFCGYLVANLFGHTAGAYNLITGVGADVVAQSYDSYMYLIFTVMLMLQAVGSGGDAILKWSGYHVDLYRDIRPIVSRFAHRYLHLP